MDNFSIEKIKKYLQELHARGISTSEIAHKLRSVDKFLKWALTKRFLSDSEYEQLRSFIAEFPVEPVDSPEKTVPIKERLNGILKRVFVPKSVGKTHSREVSLPVAQKLSLQHYLGISLALILMAAMGAGLYNQFFKRAETPFAFPTSLTRAGRVLSFQGRLTDSLGNPITTSTNVRFRLYKGATGGNSVYDTGTCGITPDQDGIFDVLIGGAGQSPSSPQEVCGVEIPSNVFSENPNIFLGVTVGRDSEARPRQQIANVGYAVNSETLQGFPPGTGRANIAYIDSLGTLGVAPVITASSGSSSYVIKAQPTLSGGLSSAQTNFFTNYSVPLVNLSGGSNNTLTNLYGNYQGLTVSAGRVTNYYGMYVAEPSTSGTGTIVNKYALIVEGGAGNVGIGDTTPIATFTVGNGDLFQVAGSTGNVRTAGDIAVNGGDITTDDDLTLTPSGGQVIIADGAVLNAGGLTGVGYNAFANSGEAPDEAAITSDNDVYIGGDLEVDGTIYGFTTLDCTDCIDFDDISDNPTLDATTTIGFGANNFVFNLDSTGDFVIQDAGVARFTFNDSGSLDVASDVYIGLGAAAGRLVFTDAATDEIDIQNADLDLNTNIITNIGNAGTDFDTSGGLTLAGDLAVNGGDLTSSATTFNLLNSTVTTLNIGGAATAVSIGAATGTTTINNATTVISGNLDVNGLANDIAGTLNLSGNTLTSSDDLTIDPAGGQLYLADTDVINIGGVTGLAYNALSNAGGAASNGVVSSDNDLYVQGDLEVDGSLFADGTITAGDLSCTDCLDFTDFEDTLDLDASTSITADGTEVLSIVNTGTGNTFLIEDQASDPSPFVIDANGNVGIGLTTATNFKLEMAGHVGPTIGSSYDLGSSARRWANVWADTGNFTNISGTVTGGSTTSNDWLINSDNATADAEDVTLTFERGTPAVNSQIRWNSTTKQITTNTSSFVIDGDPGITFSGTAALIVNQIQNQDILTASASGVTRFTVANNGDVTTTGDLAVNGDDITSDGNLTINATGYVRIGDTGTPGSATGDDDLYVEGDLEVDGTIFADGTITATDLSCTDCLDFTDFEDQLDLDASTDILADGSEVLSITNTGTGNSFLVNDAAGDTSPFVIDASGNVGIGTTTLVELLTLQQEDPYVRFNMGSSSTQLGGLKFFQGATDNGVIGYNSGSGLGIFRTSINNARLVINSSGNTEVIGIAPVLTFTDSSSTRTAKIELESGAEIFYDEGAGDRLSITVLDFADNDLYLDNQRPGRSIVMNTTPVAGVSTERLRIDSAGNVGIGDTGPDSKLEVLATTEQLRLTHTDDTTDARFAVSSTGDLTLDMLGSGTTDQLVLADTDTLNIGGSGSTEVAYNVIGDSTTGASASMNSDDDLYVEGDLEVDGTIIGTVTATDLSCTDCLDFTDFEDTLDLDASTEVNFGANNFTFDLDSTGDFVISDTGTPRFTFNDSGNLDVADDVYIGLGAAAGRIEFDDQTIDEVNILDANVGIGTDAPRFQVEIAGLSSGPGYLDLRNTDASTGGVADGTILGQITFSGTDSVAPGPHQTAAAIQGLGGASWTATPSTHDGILAFFTQTDSSIGLQERMRILPDGNVGINTTGPDRRLDILEAAAPQLRLTQADGTVFTDFQTDSGGDLTINPSGGQVLFADTDVFNIGGVTALAYNALSNAGGAASNGAVSSDNDLYVQGDLEIDGSLFADGTISAGDLSCTDCLDFTDFEDTLDLDASTEVNFGANAFTFDLDGTGDFVIADSGTPRFTFNDSGNLAVVDGVTIGLGSGAGLIEFDDQATDEVNILNANVGIGTATPGSDKLRVVGGLSRFVPATDGNTIAVSDAAISRSFIVSTLTVAGAAGYSLGSNTAVPIDFFTDDLARMTIGSTGNVGIGATDPDSRLTIANSGTTTNQIRLRSARAHISVGEVVGGIDFMSNDVDLTAPGTVTAQIQALATGTHSASALDTYLSFYTTDVLTMTERMRILDTGNVGINTTGPDRKLDVLDATNPQLRLTQADGTVFTDFQTDSGGDLTINPSGGQVYFSDTDVLNIGGLTGVAYNALANAGEAPEEAAISSDNDLYIGGDLEVDGSIFGTVTATDLSCTDCLDFTDFEDTLDLDADLVLNQGTNIWTQNFTGTTTTGLTYNANSLTSGKGLFVSSTASAFTGTLFDISLSGNNAANTGTVFKVSSTGASNAGTLAMLTNAGTGASLRVNDDGTDTDTTPFLIDASGNVGIGTAAPTAKLEVAGNLKITNGGLIATPGTPTIAGSVADATNLNAARGVAVQGRYAYVPSSSSDSLSIIDIAVPTSPQRISTITDTDNLDGAADAAVTGRYVYVASITDDSITIVDVSNPAFPTQVGSVASSSQLDATESLYFSGKYVFAVAPADDRITAVDVSNPATPTIVGSSAIDAVNSNTPYDIYIQGNFAYVTARLDSGGLTTGTRLVIFDISDPTNIVMLSATTSPNLNDARGLYVSGRYAYVTGLESDSLVIFDVSNPYTPTQVGFITDTDLDGVQAVEVAGKHAYLTTSGSDAFVIVDVSNPASPTKVTSILSSTQLDNGRRIALAGRYAYIPALDDDMFTVVDLGYELPSLYVGNFAASQLKVEDNAAFGNTLWVGGGTTIGGNLNVNDTISSYVKTASASAGIQYGIRSIMTDTGATSATDTTYGFHNVTTRTGATTGTVNTTGGFFNVVGDTGGTSKTIGLDVTVSGADTNYAGLFNGGFVGIGTTAPTAWLHIVGAQPASVATTPGTAASNTITGTGGVGGDTTITGTGVGGVGGAYTLTGGAGGRATSADVLSTGGVGGAFTFTGGVGGAASVAGTGNNTSGAGGAFAWTAGAGGAANGATSGTNTGGAGGAVTLSAGTGGAATTGTGSLNGGNGGALTISGGTGGTGATAGGSGGLVTIQGGASAASPGANAGGLTLSGRNSSATGTGGNGGTVTISGGNAAGDNTVNRSGGALTTSTGSSRGSTTGGGWTFTGGGAGQNLGTGSQTGAAGGAITFTMGTAGTAPNAEVSSTGGIGSIFTITGGPGGAASVAGTGTNTGGAGSAFTWTAGVGGAATGATSGTNTGGAGGAVTLQAGTGGAANTGSGNLVGGTGGALTLSGGTGGVGSTSGGNGGAVTLQGGTAAAMAGAAGGAATVSGRTGSATGTGGAGGAVTISGGNAGGDNTVNRAGGAITMTAGLSRGPTQAGGAITSTAGGAGQNTATGTQTGPVGGGITLTTGAGGQAPNAEVASTGGIGGALNLTGGVGAAAAVAGTGNNTGGKGSIFTFTAGTGGAASGATSGTNVGGAGGDISLVGGQGGAASAGGTNTGGVGGSLYLVGGQAGSGGSPSAGNVNLAVNSAGTARGNVGIGTIAPVSLLDVSSATGAVETLSRADTSVFSTNMIGKLQFWNNDTALTTQQIYADIEVQATQDITTDAAAGRMIFRTTGSTVGGSPVERMRIESTGNIGINTTGPDRILDVLDATNPQLRLTQADGTVFTDFQTDSGGDLTINVTGGDIRFADTDTLTVGGLTSGIAYSAFANTGEAPEEASISTDNDLYIGGDLEVDGSIFGTITATDLSCTDCLDFTDFEDTLDLDASTEINLGANAFTFDLDSTGDFILSDGGVAFVTFADDGSTTFANDIAVNGDDITSDGDLTIDPAGGQVLFADTDVFNIGGLTAVAYNALANAGEAPEEAGISTDNDLYIGGDLEVDGSIFGTVTATDLSCTDCLDFTDFEDTLDVDAATDINLGANALTIDLDSTGDFSIRDVATDIATFADSGAITFAPTSGEDVILNFAGNGRLDVNPVTYENNLGAIDVVRTGNFTGVDTETANDLRIVPSLTLTEPASGTFTWYGGNIDMSGISVTADAGTSTLAALRLVANADADAGTNYALFVDAGTTRLDADTIVGGNTSATETLANAGFVMDGDDLFVAGTAGIEGNVYTDGSFITGATTTYADGSITSSGTLTLDSSGTVQLGTDDDLLPQLGAGDAELGASGTRWDTVYAVTGNFSGAVTLSDITCTDCLDFAEFEDTLDLDAALIVNQATNTWTQDFTGTTTTGLTYNANSLTSGKAAFVSSTAVAFTGNLVDIALSGDNAANTGTLFRVSSTGAANTGTVAMVTNLGAGSSFRVNDETGDTDSSPFLIDASGQVGIGTATPGVKLHIANTGIDGDILRLEDSDGTCNHDPEAGTETVTCSSDESLKTDIVDAGSSLEFLSRYNIKDYTVKASGNRMTGVIAQDVAITHPETVSRSSSGILQVALPNPWQLVKAIQELDEKITLIGNMRAYSEVALEYAKTAYIEVKELTAEKIVVAQVQTIVLTTQLLEATSATFEQITAKSANIEQLVVESLTAKGPIQSPIIETGTINAQNITSDTIEANTAEAETVKTNTIEAKENDVTISLNEKPQESGKLSQLIIKGLKGKKVATIDTEGNATFSGTLAAKKVESEQIKTDKLKAQEASLSGKLTAKEIESDTISEIRNRIQNVSDNTSSLNSQFSNSQTSINDIQALLADIRTQPLPQTQNYQNLGPDDRFLYEDGKFIFENVTITGNANLYKATVSDSLVAGNVLIKEDTILSLTSELKLSALSTINLFDGAVVIARDGTITTKGAVVAQGGVKTNKIEPLNTGENVTINNLATDNLTVSHKFLEATSEASVIAADDNFEQNGRSSPAIETKKEIAGVGIVPEDADEIVIYNSSVGQDSLIYLTPTGSNTNKPLSVISKKSCSQNQKECKPYFTVSAGTGNHSEIRFNWLIIN